MKDIERFICAFDAPYNGARTFINDGSKVILKRCFVSNKDGTFHPFQKGMIYRISDKLIFVATEEGSLVISQIFDFEGRDIFKEIKCGDRFFTPSEYLEKAKQYRAKYLPEGIKEP